LGGRGSKEDDFPSFQVPKQKCRLEGSQESNNFIHFNFKECTCEEQTNPVNAQREALLNVEGGENVTIKKPPK
jgi:hypothetical protein